MALTTAQQVRLRIADPWRYAQEVRAGDGTASAFKLAQGAPHSTISAASALVATTAGWSASGATFETALGLATFSGVISAQSAWMAAYQWAVFSDEEVGNFITAGGLTVPARRFSLPGADVRRREAGEWAAGRLEFETIRRACTNDPTTA
jgi:hypothetical protein